MIRALAVVALLGLALAGVSAFPPLPQNTTNCGYKPTATEPCGPQCARVGADGTCADSCGHGPCTVDSDCGLYPWAPCSACVNGVCSSNAAHGHCIQDRPHTPGTPVAPVLPDAWNSSFVMFNYTNPDDVKGVRGFTWYDDSVGGLRQDFLEGPCPFMELQPPASNENQCSVLFYKGWNYYAYYNEDGTPGTCCAYHFPVWRPNSYRVGNASFAGNERIRGLETDFWYFSYACPWIRPQPEGPWPDRLPAGMTSTRNIYTLAGTNIPVRINETLTSGYTDFLDVNIGAQNTNAVFADFLAQFNVLDNTSPDFAKKCSHYNARGRLGYLGYD